jgi:RNA polymerase primary sigma factor
MIPDSEQELIAQYLKKVSKIPLLKPEEEKELARRAKEGDKEAYRKLVESNLRFVISIAKQYLGYGLRLSELIAAGNWRKDRRSKILTGGKTWQRRSL